MSTRDAVNGIGEHGEERDADAAFDELGRRAGAALRRPAPENGVGEIARHSRRERLTKTGAICGVALLLVAGGVVILDADDEPDALVPSETTTLDSSVPSVPVTTTDSTVVASPPVTSFAVPWTLDGPIETSMQVLEQKVTSSSIGDLRWTMLESAFGGGFAAHRPVRGQRGFMAIRAGGLIISEDGASWRRLTAAVPGVPLGLNATYDGRFELAVRADNGATQYWQSSDLESWGLAHDESDVVAFSDWIEGPGLVKEAFDRPFPGRVLVLPDGSPMTSVSVGLDIRGQIAALVADDEYHQALANGRGAEIWWEPSDSTGLSGIAGVAVIHNSSWGTWAQAKAASSGTFEVELSISGEPDAWAVEVRDPSNGESLGVVRGALSAGDLASTLEALMQAGFHEWFLIDGESAELVQPDWADAVDAGNALYSSTDEGSIVFVSAYSPDPPAIWRSADGRTWEALAPTGWKEAAPSWAQMSQIFRAPDGGFMAMFSGGQGELAFLTSADGLSWQPAEQPSALGAGFDSMVYATERGFVLVAIPWGEEDFAKMWTSVDGRFWEPVDTDELFSGNMADRVPTGAGGFGSTPNLVTMNRSFEGGLEIDWLIEIG